MDTTYLKEFLVMSRLCNYTAAADVLFISQPTLYKHIKSLEAEVGVPLFEKHGKKIDLSPFGKMFIPHAQKILEESEQYLAEVESELQERSNALRIVTNYNIKELTKGFFKEHRRYKIHALIHDDSLESAFEVTDCELALFCCPEIPGPQYETIRYFDEEIVAVLPASHPLAGQTSVTLDKLRGEEFITPSASGKQSISPSFLYSGVFDHFQPRVALNIEYGSEAAQLVSQGFGISLLFRKTIESLNLDGLTLLSLEPAVICPVCLCWRKGSELSPGAKEFVAYVQTRSPDIEKAK